MGNLIEGASHTSKMTVTSADTALSRGSGDMEVLATPAMIALMENAAMMAVANDMEDGNTTVGTLMSVTHVKPTKMGDNVEATATLIKVEGRKLTFKVVANDKNGLIGEGTHERFIVNKEKFMSKLS